jgi:HlyD family secretion protein
MRCGTNEKIKNNDDMKKYIKYIVLGAIVLVFLGTFWHLWKKSRPETVEYEEETVVRTSLQKVTVVTGAIEPRDEVNIKPQISGIISEIVKRAGETVREGEVIARVKVIPEMGQLSAAQSRVRIAEINLKQAQTDFDREQALYDQRLVSAEEYDKVRQALAQAKEEKSAADESLEVIRDGVSRRNATASSTLIRATVSGLILDIPVKVGNSVIQSNTLNDGTTIATVADMDDLIFRGNLDETEVGRVDEGTPMTITLGALQGVQLDATLEYISPKAVQNNGANQFEIKAAVKPQEGVKIRSGYSANAQIVLEKADSVLAVPEGTITFEGDSTFVYKVGEKGEYEKTAVTTGLSDGVMIEIGDGLREGDRVRGNRKFDEKKR